MMTNTQPQFRERRRGQSLFEVMIGLAVGVVLIAAGTFAITASLRSRATIQRLQTGSALTQELTDGLRGVSRANWRVLSSLGRGLSAPYFLIASGTQLVPVSGREGVLENDIGGGLTTRWGFDEATGTVAFDMSGNGNQGTVQGGAIASGTVGTAYDVAAAWQRTLRDWPDYVPAGLTLTFWMRADMVTNPGGPYRDLVGMNLDTDNTRFRLTTGTNAIVWYDVFRNGVATCGTPDTGVVPAVGRWYHVAGTWDGASLRTYVNGVARTSSTCSMSPGYVSTGLSAGNSADVFDGQIDDVRVYNRALSGTEIERLASAGVFTRSFYLNDVCRTVDASSTILGSPPCGGGSTLDPSTLSGVVTTQWPGSAAPGQLTAATYLTRWGNEVFWQTDWSGGPGGGPATDPGNTFASSSNVDVTPNGSIRIHGI